MADTEKEISRAAVAGSKKPKNKKAAKHKSSSKKASGKKSDDRKAEGMKDTAGPTKTATPSNDVDAKARERIAAAASAAASALSTPKGGGIAGLLDDPPDSSKEPAPVERPDYRPPAGAVDATLETAEATAAEGPQSSSAPVESTDTEPPAEPTTSATATESTDEIPAGRRKPDEPPAVESPELHAEAVEPAEVKPEAVEPPAPSTARDRAAGPKPADITPAAAQRRDKAGRPWSTALILILLAIAAYFYVRSILPMQTADAPTTTAAATTAAPAGKAEPPVVTADGPVAPAAGIDPRLVEALAKHLPPPANETGLRPLPAEQLELIKRVFAPELLESAEPGGDAAGDGQSEARPDGEATVR